MGHFIWISETLTVEVVKSSLLFINFSSMNSVHPIFFISLLISFVRSNEN